MSEATVEKTTVKHQTWAGDNQTKERLKLRAKAVRKAKQLIRARLTVEVADKTIRT